MDKPELFPPLARVTTLTRDLRTALLVAEALDVKEIDVLAYSGNMEYPGAPVAARPHEHWFSFDAGGRRFAIWRNTGKLYECDADGAVGDDPLEINDLKPDE